MTEEMNQNINQFCEEMIFPRLYENFSKEKPHTFDEIFNWIKKNIGFFDDVVNNDEKLSFVKKRIQEEMYIIINQQGRVHTIKNKSTPTWFFEKEKNIEFTHWDRIKQYLIKTNKIGPYLSQLDDVTSRILDGCGDPLQQEKFSHTGLVIGQVQSGKTLNYTSLISKAVDAGYKLIILLTGVTEPLRQQTQKQLDNYIMLYEQLGLDRKDSSVARMLNIDIQNTTLPQAQTTSEKDFQTNIAMVSNIVGSPETVKIWVMKKNNSILKNFYKSIESTPLIEPPLLFIDDEADNASINTNKPENSPTKINESIRKILKKFKKNSYVGYTATPFANIFVDPDLEQKIVHEKKGSDGAIITNQIVAEDLFPNNFIHYIEPPTVSYMGYKKFFLNDVEDSDYSNGDFGLYNSYQKYIRIIQNDDFDGENNEGRLPLKHKNGFYPEELPESLKHAIRVFLITRSIQILKGFKGNVSIKQPDGSVHQTMLINVSRFNSVQDRVYILVVSYFDIIKNSIKINSGNYELSLNDPNIKELKKSYEIEFGDEEKLSDISFDNILDKLFDAMNTIKIRISNREHKGSLNYDNQAENPQGLHVIAIGGLQLSRGLVLEGLTTSYMLRNTGASDTLLQMARWFGYRKVPSDYEYLCRVYLPESTYQHYYYISDAVEDLNSHVKYMGKRGLTPLEFGLYVRQSPTGIKITAANKMRSAQQNIIQFFNYSGNTVRFNKILNDRKKNERNVELSKQKLKELWEKYNLNFDKRDKNSNHFYFRDIPVEFIQSIFQSELGSNFPQEMYGFTKESQSDKSLLEDYIERRKNSDCKLWDLGIMSLKKRNEAEVRIGDMTIFPRRRSGCLDANDPRKYLISKGSINFHDADNKLTGTRVDNNIGFTDEELNEYNEELRKLKEEGTKGNSRFFNLKRKKPLILFHYFEKKSNKNEQDYIPDIYFTLSIFFNESQNKELSTKKITANKVFIRQQQQSEDEEWFEDDDDLNDEDN